MKNVNNLSTVDAKALILTADVDLKDMAKLLEHTDQLYSLPGVDDKFFVSLDEVHDDIKDVLLNQTGDDSKADISHVHVPAINADVFGVNSFNPGIDNHAQAIGADSFDTGNFGTNSFSSSIDNLTVTSSFTDFMKLFESTSQPTETKAPDEKDTSAINTSTPSPDSAFDNAPLHNDHYHNTDKTLSDWNIVGSYALSSPLGHDALPGYTTASSSFSLVNFLNPNAGETTIEGLSGINFTNASFGSFNVSFGEIGVANDLVLPQTNTSTPQTVTAVDDSVRLFFGEGENDFTFGAFIQYSDLLSNDSGAGALSVVSLNFTSGGTTTTVPVPTTNSTDYSGPGFDFTLYPNESGSGFFIGTNSLPPSGITAITYTATDGISTATAEIHLPVA